MYAVREATLEDFNDGSAQRQPVASAVAAKAAHVDAPKTGAQNIDAQIVDEFEPIKSDVPKATYDYFKRAFDLAGALSLLLVVSPIMLITALVVRLSSRGPIVFRQDRLTKGGAVFTLYKFRTMVDGAERGTGAVWAVNDDPRVTKLGRFLRRTRIDELPQLFNVLEGDMSLIGPRPERPEFAARLAKEFPSFNRRLEVKAGITGLAQVGTGYAACMRSYRKKLALDLIYIQNRCLMLDLRIALKTVLVVITGSGAR